MEKSKFVKTKALKNGMKVSEMVYDEYGRMLIADGVILDDFMIQALPKLGISGVYVHHGQEEEKEIVITEKIQETIENNRVADRSKVELTESVKERVAEGIQYIFNSTESEHFMNAANSVTNDLLKAITENDAVAVDVGRLKVSDEYTFKHSVDVATMAMIIAKKHGMSQEEIYELGITGLLHDIGKSKIPLEILNKPGRLTEEEFALMKKHTVFAYDMLKEGQLSERVLKGVLQHHEKLDGTGYPYGISGNEISTYARVISVADIYDALVTVRPYKDAFSQRDAVEMIMSMTDVLDISVMRSFLGSVILYPVDSIVNLSNGEKAKVVENHSSNILRPTVVGLLTGKVYNLADDLNCASIIIQ